MCSPKALRLVCWAGWLSVRMGGWVVGPLWRLLASLNLIPTLHLPSFPGYLLLANTATTTTATTTTALSLSLTHSLDPYTPHTHTHTLAHRTKQRYSQYVMFMHCLSPSLCLSVCLFWFPASQHMHCVALLGLAVHLLP